MGAARRCGCGCRGDAQVRIWGQRAGVNMGRRAGVGVGVRAARRCGCAVAPRVEGLIFVKQTLGKDARIVRVRVFHIVSTASSSFLKNV